jgi:hypothetical protein
MIRKIFILILFLFSKDSIGQLFVARDTICVIENNYVLKMPCANGINYSNISSLYYKVFYKINVDNYLFYENILYLLQLNAI